MKHILFLFTLVYSTLSFAQKDTIVEQIRDTRIGEDAPVLGETPSIMPAQAVFKIVEQMPQYPGGDYAMMKFIQKNIKYPDLERESDIQGRVVLGFIVNVDGSLSDITVRKSVSHGLDKEAIRVVKLMPNFIPGRQQGKAVRVQYMLPIMFKLASPEPPKKQ